MPLLSDFHNVTRRSAALLKLLAVSMLAVLTAPGVAQARPRGPSAAQIQARIKQAQEQMAYMQLEMARYQGEVAIKQQEMFQSFDTDGDGELKGGEKSRYDAHMHAIQTGKMPNPFAAITPVGKGPRPTSPLDELKKRTAEYQTDVLAKQQEIFRSFDTNGNGHLEGAEKSKFDAHMHHIQSGAEPNPFAALGVSHKEATATPSSKGKK